MDRQAGGAGVLSLGEIGDGRSVGAPGRRPGVGREVLGQRSGVAHLGCEVVEGCIERARRGVARIVDRLVDLQAPDRVVGESEQVQLRDLAGGVAGGAHAVDVGVGSVDVGLVDGAVRDVRIFTAHLRRGALDELRPFAQRLCEAEQVLADRTRLGVLEGQAARLLGALETLIGVQA